MTTQSIAAALDARAAAIAEADFTPTAHAVKRCEHATVLGEAPTDVKRWATLYYQLAKERGEAERAFYDWAEQALPETRGPGDELPDSLKRELHDRIILSVGRVKNQHALVGLIVAQMLREAYPDVHPRASIQIDTDWTVIAIDRPEPPMLMGLGLVVEQGGGHQGGSSGLH